MAWKHKYAYPPKFFYTWPNFVYTILNCKDWGIFHVCAAAACLTICIIFCQLIHFDNCAAAAARNLFFTTLPSMKLLKIWGSYKIICLCKYSGKWHGGDSHLSGGGASHIRKWKIKPWRRPYSTIICAKYECRQYYFCYIQRRPYDKTITDTLLMWSWKSVNQFGLQYFS